MTAVAVILAVRFLRDSRARHGVVRTGAYRGALARQMAAAGVPLPRGRGDDASLAAYNAYLQALSDHRTPAVPARTLGEGEDS